MKVPKELLLTFLAVVFQLFAFSQYALLEDYHDQSGMAIGAKITTFGPGVELNVSLNKSIAFRAGAAAFAYKYTQDINTGDAIARNARASLGVISLGLDWQFIGFVHLSGGVLYNFSHIDFDVTPSKPNSGNNGTVYYHLVPHKYCPYFLLGFGRSVSKNRVVSVGFDVGLTYQGKTIVSSEVEGNISEKTLSKWNYNVESSSRLYNIYPVVSLMIAFRIL
ncbi:MAG: hypothetical protein WC341_04620 [Bacteroidales bacterium]|jgi:hypothetical protein